MKAGERAVALLVLGIVLAVIVRANLRESAPRAPRFETTANGRAAATTRDQLQRTIDAMQLLLRREPTPPPAAALLGHPFPPQGRLAALAGLCSCALQGLELVLTRV